MNIKIIRKSVVRSEVEKMAQALFGDMVKGVVDIEKEILALDMELHADGEAILIESGSLQANLWGINLYPGKSNADFVEFDSMINIRPYQGNRSRGVEDVAIQKRIIEIINRLIR